MFFIIVTTAMTLHEKGIMHLETSREVAEALPPIASKFAYALYTLGLLGLVSLRFPRSQVRLLMLLATCSTGSKD
jgi:hypothetical protein